MTPSLEGEKVRLRALAPDDAPALERWFADFEITRTMRAWRPLPPAREYLEQVAESACDLTFGVVRRSDARLIGVAGLQAVDARHRSAVFGIVIGERDAWGQGLGTEATGLVVRAGFERLGLHRIALEVLADNARGLRAYERVGFRREGLLREAEWREGRWVDAVVMGLLEDEWRAGR